jgi:hypothetical protein
LSLNLFEFCWRHSVHPSEGWYRSFFKGYRMLYISGRGQPLWQLSWKYVFVLFHVFVDMRTSKRFGSTSTPSNQPRWLE